MIKNFTPRLYQETILATAAKKNTLVVLPTGMGKTNIFLMLAAHRLKQYPNSKIILLSPTRPLINQYFEVFKKNFEIKEEDLAIFTGHVAPEKREALWKTAKIIFSTPQGLENDIISKRINLEEASLLGIDEAHRAVGDYAYVWVAKQYQKLAKFPRVLGLTASPGSDMEKITEVCRNLFIEDIEVRTEDDPDVKPYIQEVELQWIKVKLPPLFGETQNYLKAFIKDRLEKLKHSGLLHRADLNYVSKTDLLSLAAQLRGQAVAERNNFVLWNGVSLVAEVMKVYHALELLETQGIYALYKYMEKLNSEGYSGKTKAIKNIVKDLNFRSALIKSESLFKEGIQHPKLIELIHIIEKELKENKGMKLIVFNQYRDNALDVETALNKIPGVRARLFVGQAKKGETGSTQKEQKKIIEDFTSGIFNILVATSVAEEGLDIPKVDLVIFYEPVPSAIRHIQRRGRTGRLEKGKVLILMSQETRDEGYRWSAHHKEKKMHRILLGLKNSLSSVFTKNENQKLEKFVAEGDKTLIFADHREKSSGVVKELIELSANIRLEQLESADYLLSDRCGVEIKTVEDFVSSIIDGRLLLQLKDLKKNFERPLLIIEGVEDIFAVRNVHANAIRGMLATIAVSYGIPLLYSRNAKETAALLLIIAKREQEQRGKEFTMHGEKTVWSLKDLQEYIVSAFPGVGGTLAKPLLKKFKSVKSVVNASVKELQEVEKIGPKKAERIREVLDKNYEG